MLCYVYVCLKEYFRSMLYTFVHYRDWMFLLDMLSGKGKNKIKILQHTTTIITPLNIKTENNFVTITIFHVLYYPLTEYRIESINVSMTDWVYYALFKFKRHNRESDNPPRPIIVWVQFPLWSVNWKLKLGIV